MCQILIVIMAIILFSLLLAGGVNYFDLSLGARTEASRRADAGFHILESSFASYRAATGLAPTVPTSGNPASYDQWRKELFPYYGTEPIAPADMSWSYGADAEGYWFCLSGNAVTKVPYRGVYQMATSAAAGTFIVSAACGDDTTLLPNADAMVFPASAAVTFKIAKR